MLMLNLHKMYVFIHIGTYWMISRVLLQNQIIEVNNRLNIDSLLNSSNRLVEECIHQAIVLNKLTQPIVNILAFPLGDCFNYK